MKIGILQCDSVRPEFQDKFNNYPEMFQILLNKVDPTLDFKIFDVQHGQYPENLDECDGYITTGSKASVYDCAPWIKVFQDFIVTLCGQNKKLIAVCFGHQLIAQAFGGKTLKSVKGWGVGIHTCQVHKSMSWMKPSMTTFNLIVSHQDQVIKLPDNATLVAGNTFCENSMYQLGNNILAMQGHPEFNKQYSQTLMRYREDLIGEERLNEGISSLQKETDELCIARWMLHFLS